MSNIVGYRKAFLKLSFTIFIISICSCSTGEKKHLAVTGWLNAGLITSGDYINNYNLQAYSTLKQKMEDPRTRDKASIWLQKALFLQKECNNIYQSISEIKLKLEDADVWEK